MATLGRPPHGQYPPRIQRLLESMQTAQDRILNLQDQLNTAESEYDSLKLEWDEYQASIAPIRSCPNEILSTIFHFYLRENPRLVRRLLVCKQWYAIAVGDPRIWNHVSIKIPEYWQIEDVALSTQRRIERCVERSGSLLLDLDLDLNHLRSATDQIIEHIRGSLDHMGSVAEWNAIYDWSEGLDVVKLVESPIATAYHPEPILKAIQKLIGDGGEIMDRWGTVKLTFPDNTLLAVEMWQKFAWPAPNLTSLVIHWDDSMEEYLDDLTAGFPQLPSLKHLDVNATESLEFLHLRYSSLESLVIYYGPLSWGTLGLSRFAQLRRLEVIAGVLDALAERLVLHLPNLQHLVMSGSVEHLDTVDFQVPVLDTLEFRRQPYSFPSTPLPIVQTLHVRWLMGGVGIADELLQRSLTHEIKSILAQFNTAVSLTINEVTRSILVEGIRSLRVDGRLPSALVTIVVIKEDGDEETLLVSSL